MKIYEWGQLYFGKQDLQSLGHCHWCRYILLPPFMTLGKWGSVYVWVQWGHLYMSFILQLERRPVQCDRVECHHGLYSDNVTPLAGLCTFWYWVASKFSPSQHLLHYFSGYALARLQRSLGTFFTHRGPKNWHFARGQMQNKGLREETSCFNI